MIELMLGFILSSTIAVGAYYRESLSTSGAASAVLMGTLIYGLGGPYLFVLLMVFFLSTALIGHFFKDAMPPSRGSLQVIANGGIATYFAVRYGITAETHYLVLFAASLAVATADTWSSEIGRMAKRGPFNPLTFKPMAAGLSGAVSFLGLFAALLGSLLFGLLGFAYIQEAQAFIIITTAGFAGALIDSLLGLMQVKFIDESSGTIEDAPSSVNIYHSGVRTLTNSGVNILSNLIVVSVLYALLTNM